MPAQSAPEAPAAPWRPTPRISARPLSLALLTPLVLAALTGCGLTGPATYDPDETAVEAEPGEEFTLSVPSNASLGERWYVASPRPDGGVVRATREDHEYPDSDADGASGGTQLFGFRAVGPGRTTIRLIHCPVSACVAEGGSATASPAPSDGPTGAPARSRPDYRTYTVTVG
ncbi:protease inhibitor I42 family protein [Streptomyces sp. NPDC048611]|uniref:protease inhibitor I42 family protein n=1 Tax=Streptomyces sp. NPDC048611 TaxID=3155635 RepID=UPI00344A5B4F